MRAAAHERERRDLDRAALHERAELLRIHRVVERVEERPHVRVDLRKHVARQEPEPLPRLDGGTRQDDPAHLPVGQRRDRERDREVRLAGAGGTDPERDGGVADRVDVMLLHHSLRSDPLAAVRPDDVVEDLADVLRLVDRAQDRVDRAGTDLLAALDEVDELLHHRAGLAHLRVVALERQPVTTQVDRAPQPVAKRDQHAVADACELGGDFVRDVQDLLHAVSVGAG